MWHFFWKRGSRVKGGKKEKGDLFLVLSPSDVLCLAEAVWLVGLWSLLKQVGHILALLTPIHLLVFFLLLFSPFLRSGSSCLVLHRLAATFSPLLFSSFLLSLLFCSVYLSRHLFFFFFSPSLLSFTQAIPVLSSNGLYFPSLLFSPVCLSVSSPFLVPFSLCASFRPLLSLPSFFFSFPLAIGSTLSPSP